MRRFTSVKIILVLWVAGLCAAAQFAKIGLFLPELQLHFPNAGAGSGFLVTLISLVGAVFGLVAGMLVGQLGARRVLLTGLFIGCLASLLQSFGLPLAVLLVTRLVEGVSHLAIVVAAPTLIAFHSSERLRASAMTLWGSFFGVSYALTAWLGLPLVAARGLHTLFFAHSAVIGLAAILVVLTVPRQSSKNEDLRGIPRLISLKSLYVRHRNAWRSPYVAAPATGWLFYTFTYVALLAILPTIVESDQRALVAASMPLASIISSMTLGVALLWRYTAVQVVCFGFVVAIGFAFLFLVRPPGAILCILLFSALGIVQGASFAAIPQLNKTTGEQALAYGAIAQAGNIGNLCGTPILLALLSYGGTDAMIMSVVVCYLIGLLFHYGFSRRRAAENTTGNH